MNITPHPPGESTSTSPQGENVTPHPPGESTSTSPQGENVTSLMDVTPCPQYEDEEVSPCPPDEDVRAPPKKHRRRQHSPRQMRVTSQNTKAPAWSKQLDAGCPLASGEK